MQSKRGQKVKKIKNKNLRSFMYLIFLVEGEKKRKKKKRFLSPGINYLF